MTTNETLSPFLLDVRKAYRLLADFQTSMLNLVNDVASNLTIEYFSACHRHSPPRNYSHPAVFTRWHRLSTDARRFIHVSQQRGIRSREDERSSGRRLSFSLQARSDSKILNEEEGRTACSPEQSTSHLITYILLACKRFTDDASWYHKIWWGPKDAVGSMSPFCFTR